MKDNANPPDTAAPSKLERRVKTPNSRANPTAASTAVVAKVNSAHRGRIVLVINEPSGGNGFVKPASRMMALTHVESSHFVELKYTQYAPITVLIVKAHHDLFKQ